jgi:hypothetical protein
MNRKGIALRLALMAAALACLGAPTQAQADFGIKELSVTATEEDGSPDRLAGSHPFAFNVDFGVNLHDDALETPEGRIRTIVVDLPAGMIANPLAVPRCARFDFNQIPSICPASTQVGVVEIAFVLEGREKLVVKSPVYNLTPSFGTPASIGFNLVNIATYLDASVRTGGDYGVGISDFAIPAELEFQKVTQTIWGVPGDPAHRPERVCIVNGAEEKGCASETEFSPKPFLTLPGSCNEPMATTVHLEALENPGVFVSKTVLSEDESGTPAALTNCQALPFEPTIKARPQTEAADSPTGLGVNIHVPQHGDSAGVAAAIAKDVSVALPPGLALNPSAADGLGACLMAEIDLEGSEPARCPQDSKVGAVEVMTPLLDHSLRGSVYLGKQGENPFGSLIALYIAVDDPRTGIVLKLAGETEPDPVSGQLTVTFQGNPQLSFEDFDLELFGGSHASLTTPPTCGTYTTSAAMTPWTTPEGNDAFPFDAFQISAGARGGACPTGEAEMPNAPSFEAGTQFPLAGSYSPFVLELARENGSQRLEALNVTLPPGLTAKLAGTEECAEAQIAAAQARSGLGQGALEEASPSCPASSEIGVVNIGAGSGAPFYVQGTAYLAGPYKGAPLSMAIITPAVAGPFDLGTEVVRSALDIDEVTGQASVRSDLIPTMVHGIPLAVRSVAVKLQRPDFTLNPTSCDPMQLSGEAISPLPAAAPLLQRFQVGGCRGLGFSPKMSLKLAGGTERAKHPALRGSVSMPRGGANIKRFSFTLPASQFIDQFHISNPCTRPQFAAGRCPSSSVLGRVRVFTPLLAKPLKGPVYFRSNGGERELPDVVADLRGQVHLVSVGFVDSLRKKKSEQSRIRTTFATVPDAPVSKIVFSLKGGKKHGLLVNSQNLCAPTADQRAIVKFSAHNGKVHDVRPLVRNGCERKPGKRLKSR